MHELDGGKGSIRVAGLVPTKRMPERFHKEAISRVGAKSISSTPLQVKIARQYKGSEVTQLLNQVRLKLQEHTPEAAAHELTLFGMDAGVLPQAVEPMRLLSRAKPRQVLVPMVELPMTQPGSASQQDTLHLVVTLHEEKAVATTLLFDPKGPLAQHVGQEKARTLLIRSLNGLLVAEKHLLANPTGAEMLATLRVFPCVSLAIGTNALPPGPRLSRFDPGRRTDGAPVGRGDVEQTRESLALLASKLLRDETAWLTALPLIPKRRPLVGEVFIPFEKNDYRFQTICAGLERWVGETVPGADLVFIAGPGVSEDAVDARYFGQWSWFYGLTREELLGTPPSQQENTHPKESSLPIVPLVPRGRGRPRRTPLPDTAEKQLANRRQRTPLRLV